MGIVNFFKKDKENYDKLIYQVILQANKLFKRINRHQNTKVINLTDVREIINEVYSIIFNYDELKDKINQDNSINSKKKEKLLDLIESKKKPVLKLETMTKKYEEQLKQFENYKDIKENPDIIKAEVKEKKTIKRTNKKNE